MRNMNPLRSRESKLETIMINKQGNQNINTKRNLNNKNKTLDLRLKKWKMK